MQPLKKSLLRCLSEHSRDEAQFLCELNRLGEKEGDYIFPVLLKLLTELDFEKDDAKKYWKEILVHQEQMGVCLGRQVNLLTAICDYFFTVNKSFQTPKVVELEAFEKTAESSISDGLTGLYNRRYFDEALTNEVNRTKRYGMEFSLLFLDLDNFKNVNDSMGHKAGDVVLKRIADLILATKRGEDTAARYGGEEFVVILPETGKIKALVIAERIRQRAEEMEIISDGLKLRITVSGGLASFPIDAADASQLIQNADKAMYNAKAHGKNAIMMYSPDKRQFLRVDFLGEIHTRPLNASETESLPVKGRNLSLGGILFESKTPIAIGTYLQIQLPLPSYENSLNLTCVVMRVEEFGSSYEIGVSFLKLAGEAKNEVIQYLLKHLDTPSA